MPVDLQSDRTEEKEKDKGDMCDFGRQMLIFQV